MGITEVREAQAIDEDTMKSGQSISIKDALKQQPFYERRSCSNNLRGSLRSIDINDRKSA